MFQSLSYPESVFEIWEDRTSTISTLMSHLPGIAYRCRNDSNWTLEFVSDGCFHLTGYYSHDLIANKIISYNSLIHSQDQELIWAQVQCALRNKKSYQLEYRIFTKNGEEKWVWEKGCGVYTISGELLYLEGFITDITEHKRIENELRLLQNLTKSIINADDFEAALQVALTKICETTNWDFGEVWIKNNENLLELSKAHYINPKKQDNLAQFRFYSYDYTFSAGIGLPGKILATKQCQWMKDVSSEKSFKRFKLAQNFGLKAGFGLPIIANDQVLAVWVFFLSQACSNDEHLIKLVSTITLQLGELFLRKQKSEKLEESERRLTCLIDTIPGIFFTSKNAPDFPLTYISKGCEKLTGYTSQELINDRANFFDSLTHSDDLPLVLETLKFSIINKENYALEYRIFTKNGTEKWVWEKGYPVLDNDGNVISIEGFITDITDRHNMENALRQAEANYRDIVENAMEGIFQTTPEGKYITVNPALAKIYGYNSPQELINKTIDIENQLYVNPNRRQEFINLLEKYESLSDFQSQVYRQDGSIIWISENARAVRNLEGKLLYYEGTVEDITIAKQQENSLHLKASYDELTGLAKRTYLMENLEAAILKHEENQDYQFAILFLDLDRFKLVNDSLGHLIGDQLLIAIARRLEDCVRNKDTVCRLGGDEFVILLENVKDIKNVIQVTDRILEQLKIPFKLEKHHVFSGCSIGIFFSNILNYLMFIKQEKGELKITGEEILRYADSALYHAKKMGKGCYQVFDDTMQENALAKLELEYELRQAISLADFEIYYQPIVNLSTNKIVSFEALLRWNHPSQGLLSPQDFMDLAEESGLIIPLGKWVLEQACFQLKTWQTQSHNQDLMININLSEKQFAQPNLLELITEILTKTGLKGEHLRLEISESCWLQNIDSAKSKLQELSDQKIKLCVDNFGTGYSCLNYLYQFPIHALKIDPTFVKQIETEWGKFEIAKAIFMLANNLGMEAIATGVENKNQLTKIKELNCHLGQGYLFSPPLKSSEILL